MMNNKSGSLVISLDFEMFWGMRDKHTIASYGNNIKNEHNVIPQILALFQKYKIHATWAIVGFLFCANKDEIVQTTPEFTPTYQNEALNPYPYIQKIGFNINDDPYHYVGNLIELIKNTPNQEISTHTFSHYYCLEAGQSINQFNSDLDSAINIAKKYNIDIKSIVFPRNQYNDVYLAECQKRGICIYRGNEDHFAYRSYNAAGNTKFKRIFRLFDAYINLSGHHTYKITNKNGLVNVSSSRFLRPFLPRLKWLEWLKLRRIYKSMEYAAKNNEVFHLWWHPHNFGSNITENLLNLEKILQYYAVLESKYGMQSSSMSDCINN